MNCQAHQFSASSNCGIIAGTRVQSRAGNGVNLIFLSRSEACNLVHDAGAQPNELTIRASKELGRLHSPPWKPQPGIKRDPSFSCRLLFMSEISEKFRKVKKKKEKNFMPSQEWKVF